jgi:hypothetical protein
MAGQKTEYTGSYRKTDRELYRYSGHIHGVIMDACTTWGLMNCGN